MTESGFCVHALEWRCFRIERLKVVESWRLASRRQEQGGSSHECPRQYIRVVAAPAVYPCWTTHIERGLSVLQSQGSNTACH